MTADGQHVTSEAVREACAAYGLDTVKLAAALVRVRNKLPLIGDDVETLSRLKSALEFIVLDPRSESKQ